MRLRSAPAAAGRAGRGPNPSFAARPDNSGLVRARYGLHLDVQPTERLTLSYDGNFFSDKEAGNEIRSPWGRGGERSR